MRMKKRSVVITALALCAVIACGTFGFAGCKPKLNDALLSKNVIADFTGTAEARSEMFESEGWENGEPFNAWWKKDNVSYEGDKLSLVISKRPEEDKTADSVAGYYAGEVRSSHFYGYGDFKVRMKPSKIAGTASTFFTCTGNYDKWYDEDGTVARMNPHDEIDIEFLGKDTTHVQFNYFANGKGGHEYMYKLGFDASKEFHEYGFRWTKDDITWFVDDKPVYKVERSKIKDGERWPEEPGRVLMNYWSGTQKASAWMGAFADDYSGRSEYLWASSTATPCVDPASTKPGTEPQPSEPIPADITWDEPTVFPFATAEKYIVTTDDAAKKHTVSYTDVAKNSWKNIEASVSVRGRNYVGMTLTGKTDKDINARINVRGGGKDLAKRSYVSAGDTSVADGALCVIPANGSVDVAVYYEGTMDILQIMLDSTDKAAQSSNTNSLEITNMKLGVKGEVIESGPDKNEGVLIGADVVKFTGAYTVESSVDKASMTVKYSDIKGNSYATMNGDVSAVIGDNNTFSFNVKNNGAAVAKIRADIVCPSGSGTNGSNFCNIKADVSGAAESGNDYQWGGADWLKVAPGATATVSVEFTTGVGANAIMFFIDSSTYDDETTHTGEVVFSGMSFSKTEPAGPEIPGDGEGTAVLDSVTFTGGTEYNVSKSEDKSALTVSYTDLKGNSYKNITGDISAIVSGSNAFTFKVTNNGTKTVHIRADIMCPAGNGTQGNDGKSDFCNISAEAAGVVGSGNNYLYGGADWFTIAAGETATVTIVFTTGVGANGIRFFIDSSTWDDETTHTGTVVFSDMILFTKAA